MIAMIDNTDFLKTFRLLAPDLADATDDMVLAYRKLAEQVRVNSGTCIHRPLFI